MKRIHVDLGKDSYDIHIENAFSTGLAIISAT